MTARAIKVMEQNVRRAVRPRGEARSLAGDRRGGDNTGLQDGSDHRSNEVVVHLGACPTNRAAWQMVEHGLGRVVCCVSDMGLCDMAGGAAYRGAVWGRKWQG